MGAHPAELRFEYGDNGKPRLCLDGPVPHFNLSHAEDQAALAVCWGAEVGVDIEKIRPVERDVAGSFFSAAEIAALEALPGEQWLDGFFRCWTRKEAVVKATGFGLTCSLAAFDVSTASDAPPRLLRLEGDPEASRRWTLFELRPASETIIAVAAMTGLRHAALRQIDRTGTTSHAL